MGPFSVLLRWLPRVLALTAILIALFFRNPGLSSYEAFAEELERLRKETDCYILVMIYGSHFEKANAARGIEKG